MDPNNPHNFNTQNTPIDNNSFLQLLNVPPNSFAAMQGFYNPGVPSNAFQNNPYPIQNPFQSNSPLSPNQLQQLHHLQLLQQQQQQQQQNIPSPHSHASQMQEEEDDVEIVPETQPHNVSRAAKRERRKATSEPVRRVKWSDEEEVALVESWIAISCDSIVGNAQSIEALWSRISVHFHGLIKLEGKRTEDALSGKWTPLRNECTKFNGLYNNILNMNASGCTPQNFVEEASRQYKIKFKKAFTHLAAWRVMHSNKKWTWVEESGSQQSSGSKRPASDSIDINSEPIEIGDNDPEVRPTRPIGRNRAKKLAQQQNQANTMGKHVAEIVVEKLSGKLDEHLSFMRDFAKQKREQHEESQIEREMNALNVMPKRSLPEEDRAAMLRMKAKIRAKHAE